LQGAFVLKPKFDSELKTVEFNVGTAIRVWFGVQNDIPNPLGPAFKKTDMECAILKIEVLDQYKLMGGQEVIAKEDIGMNIYYQDWPRGGDIKFDLDLVPPARWFVVISPGVKPPLETCGGETLEVTSPEANVLENCTDTSHEGDYDCQKALSMDVAE